MMRLDGRSADPFASFFGLPTSTPLEYRGGIHPLSARYGAYAPSRGFRGYTKRNQDNLERQAQPDFVRLARQRKREEAAARRQQAIAAKVSRRALYLRWQHAARKIQRWWRDTKLAKSEKAARIIAKALLRNAQCAPARRIAASLRKLANISSRGKELEHQADLNTLKGRLFYEDGLEKLVLEADRIVGHSSEIVRTRRRAAVKELQMKLDALDARCAQESKEDNPLQRIMPRASVEENAYIQKSSNDQVEDGAGDCVADGDKDTDDNNVKTKTDNALDVCCAQNEEDDSVQKLMPTVGAAENAYIQKPSDNQLEDDAGSCVDEGDVDNINIEAQFHTELNEVLSRCSTAVRNLIDRSQDPTLDFTSIRHRLAKVETTLSELRNPSPDDLA